MKYYICFCVHVITKESETGNNKHISVYLKISIILFILLFVFRNERVIKDEIKRKNSNFEVA